MARDPKQFFGTDRPVQKYKAKNGKTFYLRELASSESDVYMRVMRHATKGFDAEHQRLLVAAVLCFEDGDRLGKLEEVTKLLADEPANLVGELFLQALSVNGGTKAEVEAEKND